MLRHPSYTIHMTICKVGSVMSRIILYAFGTWQFSLHYCKPFVFFFFFLHILVRFRGYACDSTWCACDYHEASHPVWQCARTSGH